jgi:hypothetical protein
MDIEKIVSDKNIELKQRLEIQDNFSKSRHEEKVELVLLRQKFSVELLNLRDEIALKRHKERVDILNRKFNIE